MVKLYQNRQGFIHYQIRNTLQSLNFDCDKIASECCLSPNRALAYLSHLPVYPLVTYTNRLDMCVKSAQASGFDRASEHKTTKPSTLRSTKTRFRRITFLFGLHSRTQCPSIYISVVSVLPFFF